MKDPLTLLNSDTLWCARDLSRPQRCSAKGIATGFPQLDQLLYNNGWPRGALMEIISQQHGIGELRLIAPGLVHLGHEVPHWTVWINPPFIPYAPALTALGLNVQQMLMVHPHSHKEALWAVEETLDSGSCRVALVWLDEQSLQEKQLRRLQNRAKQSRVWTILFRPLTAIKKPSPAELRIKLNSTPSSRGDTLNLSILKRRRGWAVEDIPLPLTWKPVQYPAEHINKRFTTWRDSLKAMA